VTDDRWRVLALPPLPEDLMTTLFGDEQIEIVLPPERTQDAVDALLPTADLVIGDWSHSLRVLDPGPRLAMVQMASVGHDTVDIDACATAGIPVANTAGANSVSVAEWCLSATLALLRKTVEGDAAVRRGEWPQTSMGSRELAGSRVGIVGMGSIGRYCAGIYAALGCEVSYWSRSRHDEVAATYRELDDLVADSEILVLVIALSEQTHHLLDARRLALARPSLLVVNGARGDVVDEAALAHALREGQLGGAALDVFAHEPLPADSPLRDIPGLLLSPHMAGSSSQAAMRIVSQAKENLLRAITGEPIIDVVNGADTSVRRRV